MSKERFSLQYCKGIGLQLALQLQKLGLHTLFDVLIHLPSRYEDRSRVWPLATAKLNTACLVEGIIQSVDQQPFRDKKTLLLSISDGTGELCLQWIYFSPKQAKAFSPGMRIRCYGTIKENRRRGWTMVHPEYQLLEAAEVIPGSPTYTPVYPTVKGVPQRIFHKLVTEAFAWLDQQSELIPKDLLKQFGLISFAEAAWAIHYKAIDSSPMPLERRDPAIERLIIEEWLVHQIALNKHRQEQPHRVLRAWALPAPLTLSEAFLAQLPYCLTAAQERVVSEIWQDLNQERPMLRLLQGDVGSGKTVVAAMALLSTIACGAQGALMVPTELLAEQHAQKLRQWFGPLGIEVLVLTGKLTGNHKKDLLDAISEGRGLIVVGTHALFQEQVAFKALRLVIIDEQHRFGVEQRLAFWEKGQDKERVPHQLIMTATPIPRTLAMALSAELAISVIDELPPGRKPIRTVVLPNAKRAEVINRVALQIQQGKQVYWVCPLINTSEQLQAEAAENLAEILKEALAGVRIGLIHGRQNSELKESIMYSFVHHEIDLLVATTVIEVGVDVPNACVMVIENAERMGLAQLHQLRGRVGRGSNESFCLLLFQPPLSNNAKLRLAVIRDSQDGFLIAEKDLKLRGPGELFGTRQSGVWELKVADLTKDEALLGKAQQLLPLLPEKNKEQLLNRWVVLKSEWACA